MKKILLGAVAALAMAAPGVAAADTNAVVGLQYSSIDVGGGDNIDIYGLNGGFSHDFSGGTFLQADGASTRLDSSGCCIESSYAAVHYGTRNDNYSLAGFVGLDNLAPYSGWTIGAEGQLFFSKVALSGSVSYEDFDDANLTATSVHADGTYFFTPNLGVNALVTYTDADFGSGSDNWTTWGLGGEWRFNNSPTSLVLGYRNIDISSDNLDVWTIGLNFDLGTGSLQERAKSGPGLNGAAAAHDNLQIAF